MDKSLVLVLANNLGFIVRVWRAIKLTIGKNPGMHECIFIIHSDTFVYFF
jgi:hypothetical protein